LIGLADVVVRGEGENSFRDLCRSHLAGKDPILGAAPSGAIFPAAKAISADLPDVNALKRGYGLYTSEDLGKKLCYVEASRGCPFGCEFCLSSLDRKVRFFPLEEFLADMDDLILRGARSFKFLDRTFNLDIPRAIKIMEFFLSRAQPSLYTHFEMVPSLFPQELRKTLERFAPGSLRIEMGIQTFNSEVARTIGRTSDPERELEVLAFLREGTNAIVHADLIAGLPGETLASFGAGFDALWSVRPTEIQLGMLKRLPGTPIIRHDSPFGMRYSPEPPYEVIETAHMSEGELARVRNFARFWELIVNRGHFDDLLPKLLPKSDAVFDRFMGIADSLHHTLGRSWGIPRDELRAILTQF